MDTPIRTQRPRPANSSPVPAEIRAELAALVSSIGEVKAREAVGLSRGAFARALAGLGVYPGSIALIRQALESLRQGAQP